MGTSTWMQHTCTRTCTSMQLIFWNTQHEHVYQHKQTFHLLVTALFPIYYTWRLPIIHSLQKSVSLQFITQPLYWGQTLFSSPLQIYAEGSPEVPRDYVAAMEYFKRGRDLVWWEHCHVMWWCGSHDLSHDLLPGSCGRVQWNGNALFLWNGSGAGTCTCNVILAFYIYMYVSPAYICTCIYMKTAKLTTQCTRVTILLCVACGGS